MMVSLLPGFQACRDTLTLSSGHSIVNMIKLYLPAALAISLALCLGPSALAGDAPAARPEQAPALRDQLLDRVMKDQEARKAAIEWGVNNAHVSENGVVDEDSLPPEDRVEYDGLWEAVAKTDAENTRWLKEIVNARGWPTYSEVGVDGGDAAWLILQHADRDPEFQRRCLDLMTSLPRTEVSQLNLAMLTDRVLIAEGRNQIYGTQFVARDGEWVPLRLDDEENVDARRAEVGLPPIAEYKKMLEAVMRGEIELD
jgi:hypothetical protein